MKNFSYSSFRLRSASFEIRLVYTLFLVFILAGLTTTWSFQYYRIGLSYQRIVAYYLGGEIQGQVFFPKNINVLLEEAHFHSFTMSVVFLILAHLFLGTSLRGGAKMFIIVATFLSHVGDMAGTWLIRLCSPIFACLLLAAWVGLWIGSAAMVLIPLHEMWLTRNASTEKRFT